MPLFKRTKTTTPPPAAPAPASSSAPSSGPAISLEKVTQAAPGLISLYKKAGVSLDKRGLSGQRAAVYLVLDRSGSMRGYYQDGSVQHLAERALGLCAHLDDDGTVPIVFFDSMVHPVTEVRLDDYAGVVEREHHKCGPMGTTDFTAAMHAVMLHYKRSGATAPAFVIFQTDGEPNSRGAAEQALCDAARLPIFWQFVGFGNNRFEFLRKLDELAVPRRRAVDNAGFFEAGLDPRAMDDAELYDQLMAEYPSWLAAARAQGILR